MNLSPAAAGDDALPETLPVCRAGSDAERNAALAAAFERGASAVILVEPGTHIAAQDLRALARMAEARPRDILGCRVADPGLPERIFLPGWRWSPTECQWQPDWLLELKADPDAAPLTPCRWPSPGVLLVPREVWLAVGGFDSSLSGAPALVDWCLRARARGHACFETALTCRRDPQLPGSRRAELLERYLAELPPTLQLARRHGVPHRLPGLAGQLTVHALNEECGAVDFWVDYGTPLNLPRRCAWYVVNLLRALRRPRVSATVRSVLRAFLGRAPAPEATPR